MTEVELYLESELYTKYLEVLVFRARARCRTVCFLGFRDRGVGMLPGFFLKFSLFRRFFVFPFFLTSSFGLGHSDVTEDLRPAA